MHLNAGSQVLARPLGGAVQHQKTDVKERSAILSIQQVFIGDYSMSDTVLD